jgi:hypothetical protein
VFWPTFSTSESGFGSEKTVGSRLIHKTYALMEILWHVSPLNSPTKSHQKL